ncbi:MFS transporter [Paracoccus sp. SM22M-07]|uniref:MFS transporter n=1 Tax=Paracoccus sp. SM22M-07 TaxID=1520813 RepID=UPI000920ACF1|nr:MFS transporter [Paracoccus sp. SM22M-07]OJH46058.1 arabinose ABC transporter permease [Paracoccus sp. SM22M-07]
MTSTASTIAEKDARAHHDAPVPLEPSEISIGVVIGRTSEFFDFFVYAIASVLVFPDLIFSFTDPLRGTLYSFAIFALAFIARPVGTAVFTLIDKNYGRGAKLTSALFLLGASTAMLAFLPSYEQVGAYAILFLAILRIGQGMALGGAWDGLASLLAMNAPKGRQGWYAMIPQLGAPLGLIVASGLFVFLVTSLSARDFLDFGWRYPFFVAFAINVVALFARLRIIATPEYEKQFDNLELTPVRASETIKAEGRHLLLGAFTPLASFALFHMVTVYPLSWVFLFTDESPAGFLVIEIVGAVIGLLAVMMSGIVADRIGRLRLLSMCSVAIGIFALFAPLLLNGGAVGEVIYMVVGFAILGLSFGQCSGAVAARFSKRYRYTGSALTSDIAWLIGAGFAPVVALLLSSTFGLWSGGAYLLSGAICTYIALRMTKQLDFQS